VRRAEKASFTVQIAFERTFRTLPLARANEAHRLIAANEIKGNVVLIPWDGGQAWTGRQLSAYVATFLKVFQRS
jgi:hypothetical protein